MSDFIPTSDFLADGYRSDGFHLAIDAAPNAMIVVDSKGTISFLNDPAASLFGYARAELIGSPVETVVSERFRDRHPPHRIDFAHVPERRAMGAERDLYGLRKDGSEIPIEIGLTPVSINGEKYVLTSIVDLTEHKQTEHVLAESARQHAALYRFAARLQASNSLTAIYDAALDAMPDALGCDRASVLVAERSGSCASSDGADCRRSTVRRWRAIRRGARMRRMRSQFSSTTLPSG